MEKSHHEQIEDNAFPLLVVFEYDEDRRLIDYGTYFFNASLYGEAERYKRAKSTHTIHVWWARRPFNAMRPLIFATGTKIINNASLRMMNLIANKSEISDELIVELNQFLSPETKLLDMFGGGGTIPISGYELGINSYSIDINPLSCLIQRNFLDFYPNSILEKNEILNLMEQIGKEVLDELEERTDKFFPYRKRGVVAYLNTYQYNCQSCGYIFYLSNRPWINKAKSRGKKLAFKIFDTPTQQKMEYVEINPLDVKSYGKQYRTNSPVKNKKCPKCKTDINLEIKLCKDRILSHVSIVEKRQGKEYYLTDYSLNLSEERMKLSKDLSITRDDFSTIPNWTGITNPTLYGISNYYDIFNERQKIVIMILIDILREQLNKLRTCFKENTALLIITTLSAFVDQLVDWNSRLTMWISENQQPGRAFSGPGIPMYWDYCEIDPLQNGPANLRGKLKRILSGMKHLPKRDKAGVIKQGIAQDLPFESSYFDIIVTDPPYYDNLYYSIISEFFHSWKKYIFNDIMMFKEMDEKDEMVTSKYRSPKDPHGKYVTQFNMMLLEAWRVLRDGGVMSIIYSHSTLMGWAAIYQALQQSKFMISSVQPLVIERKARPRGHNSISIDSCLVFVLHKNKNLASKFTVTENFGNVFESLGKQIVKLLRVYNWNEFDLGLTLFANGIGILSNIKESISFNEIIAELQQLEKDVQKFVPKFKLSKRSSI